MKTPAFQFYPGDWRRDLGLQSCSLAARGLWIEMLGLMHDATPYGYLKVGAKIITPERLAHLVGAPLDLVMTCLAELEEADVFSRAKDGSIYSRRLIKDWDIKQKRSNAGSKGGVFAQANHQAKAEQTVADADAVANADANAFETEWVNKIGRAELEKIFARYPDKNAAYLDKVVDSRAKEMARNVVKMSVGASRPAAARERMQQRIDAWEMENPRPFNPAQKGDWLARFETVFGFTLDAFRFATDEEIESWLKVGATA